MHSLTSYFHWDWLGTQTNIHTHSEIYFLYLTLLERIDKKKVYGEFYLSFLFFFFTATAWGGGKQVKYVLVYIPVRPKRERKK